MLFTRGKDRFYERMMQEVPGFHKDKHSGGNDGQFKYKFADIDCIHCDESKDCEHERCPHIMRNLADLATDDDFITAVEAAESCKTAQRKTLLYLKARFEGERL